MFRCWGMANSVALSLSIIGVLAFGTTVGLVYNNVPGFQARGKEGVSKPFAKPWALVAHTFLGMALGIPVALFRRWWNRSNFQEKRPLLQRAKDMLLLSIPTALRLLGAALLTAGQGWVNQSITVMLRGIELLFAVIYTILFLRRKLSKFHGSGILFCCLGFCLVGLGTILFPSDAKGPTEDARRIELRGVGLVILSQASVAAGVVAEDYLMTRSDTIRPMTIVGYEGLIGSLVIIGAALPTVYFLPGVDGEGTREDSFETLQMLASSPWLIGLLSAAFIFVFIFYLSDIYVTGYFGAVSRTVLEMVSATLLWVGGLFMGWFTRNRFGERWVKASLVELAGYAVILTGSLIYALAEAIGRKHGQGYQRFVHGKIRGLEDDFGGPPLDWDEAFSLRAKWQQKTPDEECAGTPKGQGEVGKEGLEHSGTSPH